MKLMRVPLCALVLMVWTADAQPRKSVSSLPNALLVAVDRQDLAGISDAIRKGADPNTRTEPGGPTVLMWAAGYENPRMAKCLLRMGANPNIGDRNGNTALLWAVRGRHAATARVLLSFKAAVNVRDTRGWTPLHWACINGSDGLVKLLFEQGARPNPRTRRGITPLMFCARMGNVRLMRLLLEKGASPWLKDINGRSALDWALEGKENDTYAILKHATERGLRPKKQ